MDGAKLAVNACIGLNYSRAKEKPRQRGRGKIIVYKLDFVFIKKCFHFVVVVFCQLVIPLIIGNVICDTGKVFFLVACKIEILIAF